MDRIGSDLKMWVQCFISILIDEEKDPRCLMDMTSPLTMAAPATTATATIAAPAAVATTATATTRPFGSIKGNKNKRIQGIIFYHHFK